MLDETYKIAITRFDDRIRVGGMAEIVGFNLKLAQARGVALAACARAGLAVGEYAPRLVKQATVGTGRAEKAQVHAMVARLLPGAKIAGADAADALAVAICHAHHLATARRVV